MLKHQFYYTIKPYVPWRLRILLRRIAARKQRAAAKHTWPILESASRQPAGWQGWPNGKKFAFVLTHDVEGPAGLAKCAQLAAQETSRGLRSSFNFIPQGSYEVQPELRASLSKAGFEVGVHDLEHDGKLYRSRKGFEQKAQSINKHLRSWGAAGFRSGFMLRNLNWLHLLDIEYDSSTFDTDPFELQPEGAGTIFPFWIPAPNLEDSGSAPANPRRSRGYIELPYTLPQDSTLFLLLQEQSPEIWIKKLDWVAQHGGMALINVHPDYIRFEGEPASARTYPHHFYTEFLDYVERNYSGAYWNALPREIAAFIGRPPRSMPSVSEPPLSSLPPAINR